MFDFYFQSGEFGGVGGTDWWSVAATFLGSLIGALIGVWGAILVFKMTKNNQEKNDILTKDTIQTNKIIYLNFLFTKSKENISELIYNINKVETSYANRVIVSFPVIFMPDMNSLERIVKSINQEEYYLSYMQKFKNTNIENILDSFDNSYKSILRIQELLNYYKDNSLKLIKSLNEERNKILKVIDTITQEQDNNMSFILKNKLTEYFLQANGKGVGYLCANFIENFIDPIEEIQKNAKGNESLLLEIFKLYDNYRRRIDQVSNVNHSNLNAIVKYKDTLVIYLDEMTPYIIQITTYLKSKKLVN